jgi:hypothetical protein
MGTSLGLSRFADNREQAGFIVAIPFWRAGKRAQASPATALHTTQYARAGDIR